MKSSERSTRHQRKSLTKKSMIKSQFKVSKEGVIELNGSHYDEGHVFEFEGDLPEHVQVAVDSGDLAEVGASNEPDKSDEESR